MKSLEVNSVLTELNVSDNQFGEKNTVIDQICVIIKENPTIFFMDLKHNGIYEDGNFFSKPKIGAKKILEACKEKKTTKIEMTDRYPVELSSEINTFMSKIKAKKKARGMMGMKK